MPDGVVQWFDAVSGDAAVVRGGRVYPASATEVEPIARHPGARVHFDISREGGLERAVGVTVRSAPHTMHRPIGPLPAERWAEAQWTAEQAQTVSAAERPVAVEVVTSGDVRPGTTQYALERLGAVTDEIDERILFASVRLTVARDKARERPAQAQATFDIDGQIVRARVDAPTMSEAIDLLQRRLRAKLEHRAERREALRSWSGVAEPGEWRHGDLPTERPDFFDRPPDERDVIRHQTFSYGELTPDEAAFDMEQLDDDFHLFTDLATGLDAVIERSGDGSFLLTRLRPAEVQEAPTAIALKVNEHAAPVLSLAEAIERLSSDEERFVFYADEATGRGNVLYHRHDGHYGLLAPEAVGRGVISPG